MLIRTGIGIVLLTEEMLYKVLLEAKIYVYTTHIKKDLETEKVTLLSYTPTKSVICIENMKVRYENT